MPLGGYQEPMGFLCPEYDSQIGNESQSKVQEPIIIHIGYAEELQEQTQPYYLWNVDQSETGIWIYVLLISITVIMIIIMWYRLSSRGHRSKGNDCGRRCKLFVTDMGRSHLEEDRPKRNKKNRKKYEFLKSRDNRSKLLRRKSCWRESHSMDSQTHLSASQKQNMNHRGQKAPAIYENEGLTLNVAGRNTPPLPALKFNSPDQGPVSLTGKRAAATQGSENSRNR